MKKTTKRVFLKIFIFMLILSSIGAAGYYVYDTTLNKSLSVWDNKIYYGVRISGIDVGGKSEEEAIVAVKTQLVNTLQNKPISVKIKDSNFYFSYKDFDLDYGVEEAVSEAIKYGKDFSSEEKTKIINKAADDAHNIPLDIKASDDKLTEKREYIQEKIHENPEDAKIEVVDNKINIIPEIIGLSIDEEEFAKTMNSSFTDDLDEECTVQINPTEEIPKITEDDLKGIKNLMSSYSTDYSFLNEDSAYNVEIASSMLQGILLMPNEEFSFNDITEKNEYKTANSKLNNQEVSKYAEGVSLVSSTLYRAIIRSNIKPDERHQSAKPLFGENLGFEADIIYGSDDFKFKNKYDFPIFISAKTQNKEIVFNVYGDIESLGGNIYDLGNEIISSEPNKTVYNDSMDLKIGAEEVESEGNPKSVVNSYIVAFNNGNIVNKEFIATDTYEANDKIIKRGINTEDNALTGENNFGAGSK